MPQGPGSGASLRSAPATHILQLLPDLHKLFLYGCQWFSPRNVDANRRFVLQDLRAVDQLGLMRLLRNAQPGGIPDRRPRVF